MRDAKHIVASFFALDLFLITPAWTIFVELAASVFMPIITASTRRAYLGPLVLLACAALAFTYPVMLYAGTYLVCFAIGSAFAAWRTKGALGYLLAHPTYARLLAVTLLAGAFLFRWSGEWAFHAPLPTIVEALAAAFCVHLLASVNRPRALDNGATTKLGNVSYSLYLFHFPVMCILGLAIAKLSIGVEWMALALVVSTLGATLVISFISYKHIEIRGMAIGKWVAARLLPNHSVAASA